MNSEVVSISGCRFCGLIPREGCTHTVPNWTPPVPTVPASGPWTIGQAQSRQLVMRVNAAGVPIDTVPAYDPPASTASKVGY
jgi:hypothetical protein